MTDKIVQEVENEIAEKRSWIQKHPFTSVGLGVIAGFLILGIIQVVL